MSFAVPFTGFTTRCSNVDIKVPFAGLVHPDGGDGIHAGHSNVPDAPVINIDNEQARNSIAKKPGDVARALECFMVSMNPVMRAFQHH